MIQLLRYWTIDKIMHKEETKPNKVVDKELNWCVDVAAKQSLRPINPVQKHLSSTNQINEQQKASKKEMANYLEQLQNFMQFSVHLLSSLIMSFNFLSVLSYLSLDFSQLIQWTTSKCFMHCAKMISKTSQCRSLWKLFQLQLDSAQCSVSFFFIGASYCTLRRRRQTSSDVLW